MSLDLSVKPGSCHYTKFQVHDSKSSTMIYTLQCTGNSQLCVLTHVMQQLNYVQGTGRCAHFNVKLHFLVYYKYLYNTSDTI